MGANAEIVRRAYGHLNGGEVEALVALCDPAFVLDMSERVFNPEVYDGHDGIRRFYSEVREVWEEFAWEPEELTEAGDDVVAILHSHGRGRGSGLEIDRRIAMLWRLRDGRPVSVRLYVQPAAALAAAGSEAG